MISILHMPCRSNLSFMVFQIGKLSFSKTLFNVKNPENLQMERSLHYKRNTGTQNLQ